MSVGVGERRRQIEGLGDWGLGMCSTMPGAAIGEIHHCPPAGRDDPLLVKTLFTAARLSVQVHPGQGASARGKDEAWVVLAAEPGAVIGLGLLADHDRSAIRAAALDGSIVDLMKWHPCEAGDVFFTPAGTIHAIGAGVTLFEIQQNCDVTYRLYDYGRPRELHLDAGLAVADCTRWRTPPTLGSPGQGRELLVEGPTFVLERVRLAGRARVQASAPLWMAVVAGDGTLDRRDFAPGEVWTTETPTMIEGDAELLLAYAGDKVIADLWTVM